MLLFKPTVPTVELVQLCDMGCLTRLLVTFSCRKT